MAREKFAVTESFSKAKQCRCQGKAFAVERRWWKNQANRRVRLAYRSVENELAYRSVENELPDGEFVVDVKPVTAWDII